MCVFGGGVVLHIFKKARGGSGDEATAEERQAEQIFVHA